MNIAADTILIIGLTVAIATAGYILGAFAALLFCELFLGDDD